MKAVLAAALSLALAAPAHAAAPAPLEPADAADSSLHLPGPGAPSARAPRAAQLLNGSFEQVSPDGQPTAWLRRGEPTLRVEPGGNRHPRVNARNGYFQRLASPPFGQHWCFSARLRGELGAENFILQAFDTAADGETTFLDLRVRGGPAGEWARAFHTFAPLEGTLEVGLYGLGLENWVDVDDAVLFGEDVANGSFEDDEDPADFPIWELGGGAAINGVGDRDVRLPQGAIASRVVAAADAGQQYLLRLAMLGDSVPAALSVREEWLDARGNVLSTTDPALFALAAGETTYTLAHRPAAGTRASRVVLSGEGPGAARADDIVLASVQVFPRAFTLGEDVETTGVRFLAAAPRKLQAAYFFLFRDDGSLVRSWEAPVLGGDTARVTWQPATPGAYVLRTQLMIDGQPLFAVESLDVLPASVPASAQPPATTGIPRLAWLWFLPNETDPAFYESTFALAKADGFTGAVVFGGEGRWPALAAAAAAQGIDFIPADRGLDALIKRVPGLRPFSRAEYADAFDAALGAVAASGDLIGHYAVDEPEDRRSQDNTGRAVDAAAANPAWRAPLATMSPTGLANIAVAWDRAGTPVHWVDPYPFNVASMDVQPALLAFADFLDAQRIEADSRGRELWLVQQGFSSPDFYRTVDPAATRAMTCIAIACGVDGFATFLWRALNQLDGVRGRFLEDTDLVAAQRATNALLAAMESDPAARPGDAIQRVPITDGPPTLVATRSLLPSGEVLLFAAATFLEGTGAATLSYVDGAAQPASVPFTVDAADGFARVLLPAGSTGLALATAPVQLPADERLDLPMLAEFTAPGLFLWDLERSPDASLLVATGSGAVAFIDPAIGVVGAVPGGESWHASFDDDGSVLLASRAFGLLRVDPLDLAAGAQPLFARESGTAFAAIPDGAGGAWLSHYYLGLRRVAPGGGGAWESLAHGFNPWLLVDLFGPFGGGAILALDTQGGLLRVKDTGAGGLSATTELLFDRGWRGDLSPSRDVLAIARQRRGVSLHRLDAEGRLLETAFQATALHHVADVAWLEDGLLVAIDADGDASLLRLAPGLAIAETPLRRVPTNGAALQACAAWPGHIALGLADGRVLLLDASSLWGSAWDLN